MQAELRAAVRLGPHVAQLLLARGRDGVVRDVEVREPVVARHHLAQRLVGVRLGVGFGLGFGLGLANPKNLTLEP